MSKVKLVGLVRVSGAGQAVRDTPEIQRQAIRAIATAHGAELLDVVEVVITVSDLTLTPEWRTRVMPRIAQPNTHVAVYKTDRLARPLDWSKDYLALAALQQTSTCIYSPNGIRDLSTEEGRMLTTMEALIAGGERANIIKRTRDGLRRCAAVGQAVVGKQSLPTGITYDKRAHTWGYNEDIQKVKMAFKLLLDGVSYKDIARAVGRSPTPVNAWFRNDLYRGLYLSAWSPEGSEPIRVFGGPGQLPQAVDDATWKEAQSRIKVRAKRHSKPRHTTEVHTLFSGILYSAYEPGAATSTGITFDLTKDRPDRHLVYGHLIYGKEKRTAYVCRCIHQGWTAKCGLRTWQPVERLHAGLDAYLARVTSEDWFVEHVAKHLRANDDTGDVEAQRAEVEKQVRRIERKIEMVYEDRLSGDITLDQYRGVKAKLNEELDALKARLHDLKTRPTITEDDLRAAARKLAYDPAWSTEQKRQWLSRYRVTITVANGGVENASLRLPLINAEDEVVTITDTGVTTSPTSATAPVHVVLGGARWLDLVGYDLADHWSILEATEGLYRTARVAEMLGVPYEKVRHLARSGAVPAPKRMHGRVQLWTAEEIAAVKRVLGVEK